MRFLKTFFRFCTITILCTTFTTVAWGYATETNTASPGTCSAKTSSAACNAVEGCAWWPNKKECKDSDCNNGVEPDCNAIAGCVWETGDGDGNACEVCVAGTYCVDDYGYNKTPKTCSTGYYCPTGTGVQIPCPAGTYRGTTGGTSESSCTKCSEGTYSAGGASICKFCGIGTYQDLKGQSSCKTCPDGTTTNGTGKTDSSDCIKKFNLKLYAEYQENGTTKQTSVSDSTYSVYAGNSNLFSGVSARQVIGGKLGSAPLNNKWEYNPNTDKAYITVNGTNYMLLYNGTDWFWKSTTDMSILDTQAGGSTFNLVFILTPKTYNVYMISNGIYNNSPTPKFSANTNAVATKNFGSTPADGVQPDQDKVQSCSFSASAAETYYGYIASGTTPKYYECKRNSTNFSLMTNSRNGSTSMFEPDSADNDICVGYDMTTCEAGYSCNSCDRTACAAGTYQDATGQSSCTECAVNTYQDETGQSSCKSCSAQTSSKYPSSAKGSDAISDCYLTLAAANGTYVPTTSGGEQPCPPGYYCLNGGTEVYYGSPNTPTTVAANGQCERGEYSTGGASQCSPCQEGSKTGVNGSGATSCTPCDAGTYSAQTSNWECQPCAAGKYSEESGQAYCDPCPAGKYSEGGASSCTPCEAGKYSAEGASSCTPCGPGYKTDGSPTSCTPCDAGTYSSDTANANCSPCPYGTYQEKTGQPSCTSCEDGITAVTSSPDRVFTTRDEEGNETKGATARNQCCFKSSLTLKDNLGQLEKGFSNVCWVGNGRSRI